MQKTLKCIKIMDLRKNSFSCRCFKQNSIDTLKMKNSEKHLLILKLSHKYNFSLFSQTHTFILVILLRASKVKNIPPTRGKVWLSLEKLLREFFFQQMIFQWFSKNLSVSGKNSSWNSIFLFLAILEESWDFLKMSVNFNRN